MNHALQCDQGQCPEIPPVTESGSFARSLSCVCDWSERQVMQQEVSSFADP
jgi:hypothetical protein